MMINNITKNSRIPDATVIDAKTVHIEEKKVFKIYD